MRCEYCGAEISTKFGDRAKHVKANHPEFFRRENIVKIAKMKRNQGRVWNGEHFVDPSDPSVAGKSAEELDALMGPLPPGNGHSTDDPLGSTVPQTCAVTSEAALDEDPPPEGDPPAARQTAEKPPAGKGQRAPLTTDLRYSSSVRIQPKEIRCSSNRIMIAMDVCQKALGWPAYEDLGEFLDDFIDVALNSWGFVTFAWLQVDKVPAGGGNGHES